MPEDGSDGQEVTGTCVHGGSAAVPEGVPGPACGECSRESLRHVASGQVTAVLPWEQVAVTGSQGAAQVHADNRNVVGSNPTAGALPPAHQGRGFHCLQRRS